MAKSIVLYGVFLGAFIFFCFCIGCLDLRQEPRLKEREDDTLAQQIPSFDEFRVEGFRIQDVEKAPFTSFELQIRDQLQQVYTAELGVREATGKNDGKRVEEYLAVTNLEKGYAWCAAFVSWTFAELGFKEPKTPWTPSLFPAKRVIWSQKEGSRLTVSAQEINGSEDVNPKNGDVFGIYFANLKRIAHAGFVDEWGDKYLMTVEGNTNEAGSAEGDGVYRKRRLISSIYQVANWVDTPN